MNFWVPGGGRRLRQLERGDPFLFKLHAPENFIAGGGFLGTSATDVPLSFAWETFLEANGAPSFEVMREQILRHRQPPAVEWTEPRIGCLILTQPFFFPEEEWIPSGPYWSPGNQQGKYIDLSSRPGRQLWEEVQLRFKSRAATAQEVLEGIQEPGMFGDPVLVRPRLGQGSFRFLVLDTYERRCAVTGEKALPVLDAAHIRGVKDGGQHRLDNGLLLRTDIHRLFDKGYVTVTPDYHFRVSRRLKDEFDNGEPYFPYDRQEIWRPPSAPDRPSREFLEWHADTVFRG